jgi:hypothetical protein
VKKPRQMRGGKLRLTVEPGAVEGCAVDPLTLTAPGCVPMFEDSSSEADAASIWGEIDCQVSSRHELVSAGDPHSTALGAAPSDDLARRLTVIDGDDVWGERCELGSNSRKLGPTVLYGEGDRAITFASFRLPESYALASTAWQNVMQMKQTQPAANGGGTPILSLEAKDGMWQLWQSDSTGAAETSHPVWTTPASTGGWTRFAFDVTYSQHPHQGAITVYADLNGDGDAADAGETSERLETYTLKTETEGGVAGDGIDPGEAIPSHLRVGPYHNEIIDCPGGCHVDVDNVQVVG